MCLTCMTGKNETVMSSEVKSVWQKCWVWTQNTEGYNSKHKMELEDSTMDMDIFIPHIIDS